MAKKKKINFANPPTPPLSWLNSKFQRKSVHKTKIHLNTTVEEVTVTNHYSSIIGHLAWAHSQQAMDFFSLVLAISDQVLACT